MVGSTTVTRWFADVEVVAFPRFRINEYERKKLGIGLLDYLTVLTGTEVFGRFYLFPISRFAF